MPEKPLKQRIHDGEVLIGVAIPITTSKSRLEEILSKDQLCLCLCGQPTLTL